MPGFPSSHKPMPRIAPVHEAQGQEENYGKGRGGRPWRRKRDAVMARDKYLCQPCAGTGRLTMADEVDHIVPRAEGGTDADDNLQAICRTCHDLKTKAEIARGANRSHPRRGERLNTSGNLNERAEVNAKLNETSKLNGRADVNVNMNRTTPGGGSKV